MVKVFGLVDKVLTLCYSNYMKFLLVFISILLPSLAFAQTANFQDDFSDQDISDWSGDNSDFAFVTEFGNVLLQQDAPAAGSSQLSIPSTNTVGFWEFFVRLDGFNPSNGNKTEFYLMSDTQDLDQALNGYMLQAGEDGGGDVLRLFKITAGVKDGEVLTGTTDISGGGNYRVRVNRDASGNWSLEVANSYSAPTVQEATGTDNTYTSTSFFGFKNTYTSTRADKFFFDFKIEVPPIEVTNAFINNSTSVHVDFSKNYDPATLQNSDFTINPGNINPSGINQPSGSSVELIFTNDLPSGSLDLDVTSIEDFDNQTTLADTTINLFKFDAYQTGDIVINEFLKDPPGTLEEYVELKNTSSRLLNLKDWELGDNGSLSILSNQDVAILPDSFLVVTSDTSALGAVFGNIAAIQVSLPAFNNTTDQVRLYDENGITIDSLQYTPEWGGDNVALERRSAITSSVFIENWGDSPNTNAGTAGKENEIAQDNQAPQILNFSAPDAESILITFSETLDSVEAKNTANYSILPNISISNIEYNRDRIALNLSSSLQTSVDYELTVNNQQDIFGNTLTEKVITVRFIEFTPAEIGDVIINEFLKDPDNDLPEYVELRNTSSKFINLQNWMIGDNSSINTLTTQNFTLLPDSFVVVTSDTAALKNIFGEVYALQTSLPSLNNTTDQIRLLNNNSTTLDSLEYTPEWGGDDVALERREADVASVFRENWGDSPNPLTGTPGKQNEVQQDNTAPVLENSFAVNDTRITLVYNERVASSSAQNTDNYSITPSLTIASISVNENEVILNFSTNLQNETTYSITINNQQDIFGNTLAETSIDVRYLEFSASEPSDIVINEILYQKVNENTPEFIELFNRSDNNFDLSNWTISDAANNTATLPEGTSLESGSYLVLTDRMAFASTLSNGLFLSGFPSLNDNGDGIILKTESEVTIDSLFYTEQFGGNEDGISAEKQDPNGASNDANNWSSNTSQSGNSAGVENSIFELDTENPELIFANLQQDGNVFVAFSEFIDPTNTTISVGGQSTTILTFDENNANQLVVNGNGIETATQVDLSVSNLSDIVGNSLTSGTIQVSQPITKGSVVINEILYDPLSDSEDNLPDQTEYIELYNTQDYAISLEEIFLNDAPDEDNEVNRLDPISSLFKWIPPKGYFLIFSEDQTFSFAESQLAEYFGLESQSDQFTMQIDRSSLSLSASGDAIFITDSSGTTIDSVFYDESWQNPNRVSVDGVALEKINPTGPSNAETNWSSSTDVSGGTPNQENSIFQEQSATPANVGISFSPNPFSPDDDGFEDFLSINYTLDEADYLLRIRIYDRYGREVRELVDGKPAGFSGNLIWDGLTDEGNKNRVGIYIVLFEAYNSAAGNDRNFKETVVIARKF